MTDSFSFFARIFPSLWNIYVALARKWSQGLTKYSTNKTCQFDSEEKDQDFPSWQQNSKIGQSEVKSAWKCAVWDGMKACVYIPEYWTWLLCCWTPLVWLVNLCFASIWMVIIKVILCASYTVPLQHTWWLHSCHFACFSRIMCNFRINKYRALY